MAHLSYKEYINEGNEPGLTNWVKFNWISSGSVGPTKAKYLIIADLETWLTKKAGLVNIVRYVGGYDFSSSSKYTTAYIAAGKDDPRVKTNIKVVDEVLPDNINTVDEAVEYIQTIYPDFKLSAALLPIVKISMIDPSIKWFITDFIVD